MNSSAYERESFKKDTPQGRALGCWESGGAARRGPGEIHLPGSGQDRVGTSRCGRGANAWRCRP